VAFVKYCDYRHYSRCGGAREGWVVMKPSLFCEWWGGWNSPYINHFTSPDAIIPNLYDPQSLDRYAYVNNNPVNATDPTGHQCVGEPGECLEDDGTTGPGFPGTGGTVSNPGAGNCSGAACQGDDDDDTPGVSLDPDSGDEDDNEYFCFTHPYSCDININPNAIVDPLAWTHIAEGILGGVVLFGVGDLLIGAGAFVCTSIVGCIAGVPVILAGVLAYPVGVGFIYYGVQAGEIYFDEIIEVSILSEE
jgi:hypothetical protein